MAVRVYLSLGEDVTGTDWSFLDEDNESFDIRTEKFLVELLRMFDKHIPKKTYTIRPRDKPWMTNDIRREMRKRNRLFRKWKESVTFIEERRERYRYQRN